MKCPNSRGRLDGRLQARLTAPLDWWTLGVRATETTLPFPRARVSLDMRAAFVLLLIGLAVWAGTKRPRPVPSFDAAAVNDPQKHKDVKPGSVGSAVVRVEILLDRAHFSPGEIDGRFGDNLRTALTGYQAAHRLAATGIADPDTWQSLNIDTAPAL